MRVVLVGYGGMGKVLEQVLASRGHEVIARVDPVTGDAPSLERRHAEAADIAIEFALPQAAVTNARLYADLGLSAVVGTTGWYQAVPEVRGLVEQAGIGYLYGPNFSIGVHLFYRLVAEAARLADAVADYDIAAYEMHHKRKKDSPSGTALAMADIILKHSSRKRRLVTERLDRTIEPDELHVGSVRGGTFAGTHRVLLDSEADTIELSHTARSRAGFAHGAVTGAEWLAGKKGFYSVEAFVQGLLG